MTDSLAPLVLVVDDDEDLRLALSLRLRALGYQVVEAGDGYAAVSAAARERPDVVLLDLGLPCGDGVSVLERLGRIAACNAIPVVVLSGRDPVKAAADVARFSVSALLTKPADNSRLRDALASAVAGRPNPGRPTSGIPAPGDGPQPASDQHQLSDRLGTRPRVLVVEDDDDLRHGLALRLQSFGYDVVQAGDGYAAVSVASHEHPDVVLLDLGLPGGDGVSVLQRYAHLARLSTIPVIVLTGRDPERAAAEVSRFHVSSLLEKPADNERLALALAAALGRPRHTGPPAREA